MRIGAWRSEVESGGAGGGGVGGERSGRSRRQRWLLAVVVAGGVALLASCHTTGPTFVVDTTADTTDATPGDGICDDGTGACSLRAAIMEANALPGVDAVELAAGTTYTLGIAGAGEDAAATGDLDIVEGIDLHGAGATIDAAGLDRVLDVHAPLGLVLITDVTLTGGAAADGAAVRNPLNASLGLKDVRVTANTATAGAPVASAGETLFIDGATFDANTGTTAGAVHSDDKNLIAGNATLSGNTAATAALVTSGTGTTAIVDSTITANTGGGLTVDAGTTATVTGSIIADQASGDDCTGTVASGGHNLESATTCAFGATGDQQTTDPQLAALADNGGPTPTHLPQPGSPAIDTTPTGSCSSIGVDQRDIPRPQGGGCDTGATEVRTFTVTSGGDTLDATPGDGTCADSLGDCTLRAAIGETNNLPGTDHIVVDPAVTAITLTLTGGSGGDLDITDGLAIAGNTTTITQTVAGQRVAEITSATSSFTATDLTITGGALVGEGGGIYLRAPTTLTDVAVTDNTATNGAGGGINVGFGASLTISNSTISGNTASDGGGIKGGPVTATNVTISGNTATAGTGGWRVFGGPSQLLHGTVVANTGTTAANLRANIGSAPLVLTASIVGDPTAGQNCVDSSYASGGYNVVEGGLCAGLDPTDVTAAPVLGVLADNGGPTQTHQPGFLSPTIGIVPVGTTGLCDGTIATDQRGEPRPQGVGCEAGAVEILDIPAIVVGDGGDSTDATPGDGVCDDGTGACTLRAAIMEANALTGTQTIDVAVPAVTLSLAGGGDDGGDLDVGGALLVEGNGATVTQTVAGERVLEATSGPLLVRDLTVTGGSTSGPGGGLRLANASTLERVTVTGNESTGSGGGGIVNPGPLTVIDSTISGNTAASTGGGINVNAALTITNSTVSGNTSSSGAGGGIGTGATGTATLVHTTVVDNTGSNLRHATANTFSVTASIIAGPVTGTDCTGGGTFSSGGYNVASDASCGFAAVGDQTGTDPLLGALADNGGPTLTHLPDPAGPAVEAIPVGTAGLCDGTVATDQRGAQRPFGAGCEPGAVEVQDVIVVGDGGDSVDADAGDGICDDGTGACTLRAAIGEANARPGAETIQVGVPAVTLSRTGTGDDGGDLDVAGSLTIEGGGATVTQTVTDRVLEATSGVLTMRDVTITGGDTTGPGGGLRLANASTLERVTVTGNESTGSGGGGIVNPGPLTVIDSTISGNTAASTGGGINVNAALTITNSTVSGNTSSSGAGGGIGTGSTGTATLVHTTVADNTGSNLRHATANTFSVTASIIADPVTGTDCTGGGTFTSGGYNVVSDASCGFAAVGDQTGTDPLLGALADNGGPTLTHLPDPTGPAVEAIPVGTAGMCDGTVATDQRGEARPQGIDCDAGAVEQGGVLVVDTGLDTVDAVPGDGDCLDAGGTCSLRAAILEANALAGHQRVIVTVPSVGLSLVGSDASGGDLDVAGTLTIDGGGVTVTQTVAGERVLEATSGSLVVRDLTVTGGSTSDPGGGLRLATLSTLERVTVDGNATTSSGGGIVHPGPLTLIDSTISSNTANEGGGIFANASLTVRTSTISGNGATLNGDGISTGSTATVDVRSSTIVENGAENLRRNGSAPFQVAGSIVADASTDCAGGTITSGGHNIISDASCGFAATGDQASTDPRLSPLGDHGGPTATHLPSISGPALDAIPVGTAVLCDATTPSGQRGLARPQGTACDVGAVERGLLTVTSGGDTVDAVPGDGVCADAVGDCTLRAAIGEAEAGDLHDRVVVAVGTVTLDRAGSGSGGGDLDISRYVAIDGGGAVVTQTVSGERVLDVAADLLLTDLTVAGGDATGDGGGVLLRYDGANTTTPELRGVTVAGNHADGAGGGIAVVGHVHPLLVESTVATNTADGSGGGIHVADGELQVERSTFHGNSAATGGGLHLSGSDTWLYMYHSTVSGNVAPIGAAMHSEVSFGDAFLTFVTITGHGSTTAAVVNDGSAAIKLETSVLDNPATECAVGPTATVSSDDGNVAEDVSCGLLDPDDLQGVSAMLGALADNGGPTLTHLPAVGSPVIGNASVGCAGATDQRGVARSTPSCDAGAVER